MLFMPAMFLIALQAVPTLAMIYPLKPYSATVYQQSKPANIIWEDDGYQPHIDEIGPVIVELWTGNDTRVATLAKGVVASARQLKAHLPKHLPKDVQDYYLRFVSREPEHITVYTARFTIENDRPVHFNIKANSTNTKSSGASSTTNPYPISYLLASPAPSVISSASASSASATNVAPSSNPGIWAATNFGLGRFSALNVEKLKFRLVFILWPSLIGLCMAL